MFDRFDDAFVRASVGSVFSTPRYELSSRSSFFLSSSIAYSSTLTVLTALLSFQGEKETEHYLVVGFPIQGPSGSE